MICGRPQKITFPPIRADVKRANQWQASPKHTRINHIIFNTGILCADTLIKVDSALLQRSKKIKYSRLLCLSECAGKLKYIHKVSGRVKRMVFDYNKNKTTLQAIY